MAPTTRAFKHLSDVGECWVISKVQKEISSSDFTGFPWKIDSGVAKRIFALFSGALQP